MELFFPSAFLALALAHFVALLSPGPDFFLLVGYSARYRLRGSAGLCVGIATGNGVVYLTGHYRLERAAPVYVAIYAYRALRGVVPAMDRLASGAQPTTGTGAE